MQVLLAMDDVLALDVHQNLNDLCHEVSSLWLGQSLPPF